MDLSIALVVLIEEINEEKKKVEGDGEDFRTKDSIGTQLHAGGKGMRGLSSVLSIDVRSAND
jgi:hypothetical protein